MNCEQITSESIAGYCYESILWKVLCDISTNSLFQQNNTQFPLIEPKNLVINDDTFIIANNTQLCNSCDAIWHIGALISYLSSGHPIFGGKGKKYHDEHPLIKLPSLRKEHSALTPIVQACLNINASHRISIEELKEKALNGYRECLEREKCRIVLPPKSSNLSFTSIEDWPEEMKPTTTSIKI